MIPLRGKMKCKRHLTKKQHRLERRKAKSRTDTRECWSQYGGIKGRLTDGLLAAKKSKIIVTAVFVDLTVARQFIFDNGRDDESRPTAANVLRQQQKQSIMLK